MISMILNSYPDKFYLYLVLSINKIISIMYCVVLYESKHFIFENIYKAYR